MVRLAAFSLMTVALISSSARAQAVKFEWTETDSDTAIPVAFSFSGAISMGSYQAGVNWALSQFVNLTQADVPADGSSQTYRASKLLPRIDVAALSGASAGNINAVLAGIEYCDTTPVRQRPPQHSLFWKMWVVSGWDDLMPARGELKPGDDPGIFRRNRLTPHIDRMIATAMMKATHRSQCRIPVGIVVTKLDAMSEVAPGGLALRTQRFVIPFELRENSGRLRFEQIDPAVDTARSLGSLLMVDEPGSGLIAHREIIKVVEASASYPVAFAPVSLTFRTPTCFRNPHPINCKEGRAPFMDGGAFDVLPLSVANRLYWLYNRVRASEIQWAETKHPRLLFVDVGLPRGPLKSYRDRQPKPTVAMESEGFDAVMRFLGGFLPAAREYERHVYGRTTDSATAHISTRRALPAVSEHMGYFAGFLGRPFREVDFHAGITDGLYYVANDILCDPVRLNAPAGTRPAVVDALREECVVGELRELVMSRLLIDDTGQHLIAYLLSRGEPAIDLFHGSPPPAKTDSTRLGVLKAIARAEISTIDSVVPECRARGAVTFALCADRFKVFLDRLDADSAKVAETFRAWAADDACGPEAPIATRDLCRAERDLAMLVKEPELQMHSYIGDALRRLRSVEERGQDKFPRAITRLAEAAYRSTDYRYRRGWEWDPSSIPPYVTAPSGAFSLLPYYVGTTVGIRGFEAGWQPTWHSPPGFPGPLTLVFPTSVSWVKGLGFGEKTHVNLNSTPSLAWKRISPFVNQVQGGWRMASCVEGNCPNSRTRGGWEATVHIGSKLRGSVFRHVNPSDGRRKIAGSISIVDANAILYWALHR